MHFLPCNSCEQGTHTNAKETETLLVATVSHDQEPFQKSEYFLVLNLNWATAIFILQCNTPGQTRVAQTDEEKEMGLPTDNILIHVDRFLCDSSTRTSKAAFP